MDAKIFYDNILKELTKLNIPTHSCYSDSYCYCYIPNIPAHMNANENVVFIYSGQRDNTIDIDYGYVDNFNNLYTIEYNTFHEDADFHSIITKILNYYYENIDKTP